MADPARTRTARRAREQHALAEATEHDSTVAAAARLDERALVRDTADVLPTWGSPILAERGRSRPRSAAAGPRVAPDTSCIAPKIGRSSASAAASNWPSVTIEVLELLVADWADARLPDETAREVASSAPAATRSRPSASPRDHTRPSPSTCCSRSSARQQPSSSSASRHRCPGTEIVTSSSASPGSR